MASCCCSNFNSNVLQINEGYVKYAIIILIIRRACICYGNHDQVKSFEHRPVHQIETLLILKRENSICNPFDIRKRREKKKKRKIKPKNFGSWSIKCLESAARQTIE